MHFGRSVRLSVYLSKLEWKPDSKNLYRLSDMQPRQKSRKLRNCTSTRIFFVSGSKSSGNSVSKESWVSSNVLLYNCWRSSILFLRSRSSLSASFVVFKRSLSLMIFRILWRRLDGLPSCGTKEKNDLTEDVAKAYYTLQSTSEYGTSSDFRQ